MSYALAFSYDHEVTLTIWPSRAAAETACLAALNGNAGTNYQTLAGWEADDPEGGGAFVIKSTLPEMHDTNNTFAISTQIEVVSIVNADSPERAKRLVEASLQTSHVVQCGDTSGATVARIEADIGRSIVISINGQDI